MEAIVRMTRYQFCSWKPINLSTLYHYDPTCQWYFKRQMYQLANEHQLMILSALIQLKTIV